ncbi:MAG: pyrimidine dimer DNA glycosylase/endonuclease V [archaeon]
MRLWSLHPKYLDSKGLVAVWREGLLAKHVLEGKTKGYKNHPQLNRFKDYKKTLEAINSYLYYIYIESNNRSYSFDGSKVKHLELKKEIKVTKGQVDYEFKHLLKKLKERDEKKYKEIKDSKKIEVNPIFKVVSGEVEDWERKMVSPLMFSLDIHPSGI